MVPARDDQCSIHGMPSTDDILRDMRRIQLRKDLNFLLDVLDFVFSAL
jgi:hypothetical protein